MHGKDLSKSMILSLITIDLFRSGHFVSNTVNTKVSNDGKQGTIPFRFKKIPDSALPVGSVERFSHSKWNLTLANFIYCTYLKRIFLSIGCC